ncbi:hypothetical protein B0T16DRAFT_422647 [Cercophora newfieldiana]|uniref:Uncharacterized protein n=1 Tax=Cercophora newfieldiana TaxID=92897 RepID=A0AA40CI58_9PEZI|nr:hypothetical protein B0T16DRAFT_422647 [Cercophora newfieldiana]
MPSYSVFPRIVSSEEQGHQAYAARSPVGFHPTAWQHSGTPPGSVSFPAVSYREGQSFQLPPTPAQGEFPPRRVFRNVSPDQPSFQAYPPVSHADDQPRSNFRNNVSHEGLVPGSFSHPHAQRPVLPGNNASLQYPTAEMTVAPWPSTLQTPEEDVYNFATAAPDVPTGPVVQSVQATRTVQTVEISHDYFQAYQAELSRQSTHEPCGPTKLPSPPHPPDLARPRGDRRPLLGSATSTTAPCRAPGRRRRAGCRRMQLVPTPMPASCRRIWQRWPRLIPSASR